MFLRLVFSLFLHGKESIQRKKLFSVLEEDYTFNKNNEKIDALQKRKNKEKIIYICKYLNFFSNFLFYNKVVRSKDGANRFLLNKRKLASFFFQKKNTNALRPFYLYFNFKKFSSISSIPPSEHKSKTKHISFFVLRIDFRKNVLYI